MSTSPLYTASASLQPTSGWRVVYFDAANRGECLRLLLTVADVEFEDIRLPFPSGVKPYKPAACGDRSPLPFGQLPIVQHATEGGCVSIGQTVAAAQYIAALTGLAPVDDAAAMARATSACVGIQEMYDALFYGSFIPRMVTKVLCGSVCFAPARALARYRLRGKYEKCFSTFERWLRTTKAGDVAFLAGPSLSYADVCLFDCIEGVEDCGFFEPADRASAYPLVTKLYDHVAALPAVAAYLAKRGSRFA